VNNNARRASSILILDESPVEALGNGIAKTAFADYNDFVSGIFHADLKSCEWSRCV
jgi:hypothetical protein